MQRFKKADISMPEGRFSKAAFVAAVNQVIDQ